MYFFTAMMLIFGKSSWLAFNLGILVGFFTIFILLHNITNSFRTEAPIAMRSWKKIDDLSLLEKLPHIHNPGNYIELSLIN